MRSLEKFEKVRKKIKGTWEVNPDNGVCVDSENVMCVQVRYELDSDVHVLSAHPECEQSSRMWPTTFDAEKKITETTISGKYLLAAIQAVESTDKIKISIQDNRPIRLDIQPKKDAAWDAEEPKITTILIANMEP